MATDKTSWAGVHRKKRQVDHLWFNRKLREFGWSVEQFGEALAKQLNRSTPFNKASASRRLTGHIPFTTRETEALSAIFGVPLEEILQRTGNAEIKPTSGEIEASGRVRFDLDVPARASTYVLQMATQDGWNGAAVTVATKDLPLTSARRGIYLVHFKDGNATLRQFLGVHGAQAILTAPFDTSTPVETVKAATITTLQRVTKITL